MKKFLFSALFSVMSFYALPNHDSSSKKLDNHDSSSEKLELCTAIDTVEICGQLYVVQVVSQYGCAAAQAAASFKATVAAILLQGSC